MSNDNTIEQNIILFHITLDQADKICNHFNKDVNSLEDYEISELLDKIIDEEL